MSKSINISISEEIAIWVDTTVKNDSRFRNRSHFVEEALRTLMEVKK